MTLHSPTLQAQWLTQGALDVEYKQYLFLAWLQRVRQQFDAGRVYPALGEVIEHHRFMNAFARARAAWQSGTNRSIAGIDWAHLRLIFEQDEPMGNAELEAYFEACLAFALPELDRVLEEGRELFDWIEEHLEVMPVGVVPIYRGDGYVLVYDESQHFLRTYRYAKSWIQLDDDRMIQLSLEPIEQRYKLLSESFESVKLGLIRRFKDLPNPATYLVRASMGFPLHETLLPIAKRMLLRELQGR